MIYTRLRHQSKNNSKPVELVIPDTVEHKIEHDILLMSNLVPNVLSLASRKNPGRGWSHELLISEYKRRFTSWEG